MDEAMGWAMYAVGAWAMTMRLEVKYRRPLPLDEELMVTASVGRDRGRRLEATAEIRTLDGDLLAQASGIFLRLPEERTREFNDAFLGSA
jgi:acyl-CoA thioesterase FadM